MNNLNGLLPIGSVVKIKQYEEPLMIMKICINQEGDYLGIEYPIGYNDKDKVINFNMDDIEKIFFIGRMDKKIEAELIKKTVKKKIGKRE